MSKPAHPTPRVRPRRGKSMAAKADRHELYELSVQAPETDAATLAKLYKKLRKRHAVSLREDFCGTAVLSLAWVRSRPGRTAVGIDLDQPTLDWGLAKRIEPAAPEVAQRIELHRANVLDGVGPKVDVTAALNFSYMVFQQRKDMLAYFQAARSMLVDDGVFILDLLGGWGSMGEETNRRRVKGFKYVWQQRSFDPLTHHFTCAIEFEFPDGSRIEDAFFYDWRLWTSPELRDLLYDAGFSKVHLMWERTDEDGEGNGKFYEPTEEVDNDESWWTFIVAEK